MEELAAGQGNSEGKSFIDEDDEWATDFDDDEDCLDGLDPD